MVDEGLRDVWRAGADLLHKVKDVDAAVAVVHLLGNLPTAKQRPDDPTTMLASEWVSG